MDVGVGLEGESACTFGGGGGRRGGWLVVGDGESWAATVGRAARPPEWRRMDWAEPLGHSLER